MVSVYIDLFWSSGHPTLWLDALYPFTHIHTQMAEAANVSMQGLWVQALDPGHFNTAFAAKDRTSNLLICSALPLGPYYHIEANNSIQFNEV